MWRSEKTEYLRSNRDYGSLLGEQYGDGGRPKHKDAEPRATSKSISRDRQEYLDRRQKLKELERQKMKQKLGSYSTEDNKAIHPKEERNVVNRNKEGDGGGQLDSGQSNSKSKRPLPYDRSFGSFFGPSEPIVAKRIIEEARAREEAEMVASRAVEIEEMERISVSKTHSSYSGGANLTGSNSHKSSGSIEEPKAMKPMHEVTLKSLKAQKLKEARDYSFLFSDSNGVTPAPQTKPPVAPKQEITHYSKDKHRKEAIRSNTPPPRKSLESSKVRVNQEVLKKMEASKLQSSLPKRRAAVSDATLKSEMSLKERSGSNLPPKAKSVSVPLPIKNHSVNQSKPETKLNTSMVPSTSRQALASRESLKKVAGSGMPGSSLLGPRSMEHTNIVNAKNVAEKKSKSIERQGISKADRSEIVTTRKVPLANARKPLSSGSGDQGRRVLEDRPKKTVTKAKPEVALKNPTPVKSSQLRRPDNTQKRWAKDSDDESEDSFLDDDDEGGAGGGYGGVSDYIRRMFGYNPNKYRDVDDGDDRDMEVGFNRIQAEERRSARIAREEDEKEAQLIEEEERAERARKLKRQKNCEEMNQNHNAFSLSSRFFSCPRLPIISRPVTETQYKDLCIVVSLLAGIYLFIDPRSLLCTYDIGEEY